MGISRLVGGDWISRKIKGYSANRKKECFEKKLEELGLNMRAVSNDEKKISGIVSALAAACSNPNIGNRLEYSRLVRLVDRMAKLRKDIFSVDNQKRSLLIDSQSAVPKYNLYLERVESSVSFLKSLAAESEAVFESSFKDFFKEAYLKARTPKKISPVTAAILGATMLISGAAGHYLPKAARGYFHESKTCQSAKQELVQEEILEEAMPAISLESYDDKDAFITAQFDEPQGHPQDYYQGHKGKVPILMYHKIGYPEDRYTVSPERFRSHLQRLHENGFALVSLDDYFDRKINLPPGKKPVILTFDDADKGQFMFATYKGEMIYDENHNPVVDRDCAVGMIDDFCRKNPDFGKAAKFYIDFADANHNYEAPFLQPELVKMKLHYLLANGYEIGNHTYSHIDLSKESPENIKRDFEKFRTALEGLLGEKASLIASDMAFPYGAIPKDKERREVIYSLFKRTVAAWGGVAENINSDYFKRSEAKRIETNTNLEQMVIRNPSVNR